MKLSLEQVLDLKSNSLGFTRLSLAILVILSHSFDLGGFTPLFAHPSLGAIAVDCFFIISGYLIVGSYLRSRGIFSYFWKRFLRIFPGFWVCLIVSAFLIYPLAFWLKNSSLVGIDWSASFQYISANFLLIINSNSLGNIFSDLPTKDNFNNSLWTLKYEFICYIWTAILGIVGFYRKRYAIVIITTFFYLGYIYFYPRSAYGYWEFFTFFLMGVVFYLYQGQIPWLKSLFLASAVLFFLGLIGHLYFVFAPLSLTYLLLNLGGILPMKNFEHRYGDYSYGLYIYGFPLQQILVLVQGNQWGIMPYFCLSVLLSLLLAFASWHLVEKPCLKLKSAQKRPT